MSGTLPGGGSAARNLETQRQLHPFLFWHEDTIVVPMVVNGVTTAAIFDTAAAVSAVDDRFARRAGIIATSAGQSLAGPGGTFQAFKTPSFQVSIGDNVARIDWAAAIDLSEVSRATGWAVGFLLGQDILRRFVFDFRFDTARFSVAPRARVPDTSGLAELLLARGRRQEPILEIAIEDLPAVPAVLDTGSSSPLILSGDYADAAGLSSRPTSTGLAATASGLSVVRLVTVKEVRMGHLRRSAVPTQLNATWTSDGPPASVGMPLLAAPRLVFDFGGDRLWRSDPPQALLGRDRSGLGIVARPDRLVVVHVAAGSPAEAAGWKEHEEITRIDGERVSLFYNTGDLWRWRFQPAGTRVRVTLGDGSKRDLRLADYY